MTNEQIQQWALEAKFIPHTDRKDPLFTGKTKELQAFATLVRQHTLEEAAANADSVLRQLDLPAIRREILYQIKGTR